MAGWKNEEMVLCHYDCSSVGSDNPINFWENMLMVSADCRNGQPKNSEVSTQ